MESLSSRKAVSYTSAMKICFGFYQVNVEQFIEVSFDDAMLCECNALFIRAMKMKLNFGIYVYLIHSRFS